MVFDTQIHNFVFLRLAKGCWYKLDQSSCFKKKFRFWYTFAITKTFCMKFCQQENENKLLIIGIIGSIIGFRKISKKIFFLFKKDGLMSMSHILGVIHMLKCMYAKCIA